MTIKEKIEKELETKYGKSEKETSVLGVGIFKLGQTYKFKDGIWRRLVHIEYRNMAVDLLRFDDGTELFTGDLFQVLNLEKPKQKYFSKKVLDILKK